MIKQYSTNPSLSLDRLSTKAERSLQGLWCGVPCLACGMPTWMGTKQSHQARRPHRPPCGVAPPFPWTLTLPVVCHHTPCGGL